MEEYTKTITKNRRKGFVLISALLITSISVIILIPYVSGVLTDLRLTSIINNSTVALDLAEAGAERAIWEIGYNSKTTDFTILLSSLSQGEYEATVIFPDSNSATIKSYGYVPDKALSKAKKIVVVTYSIHRAFGKAIAGVDSITMSGQASTDSYDSSLGEYNAMVDGVLNIGQEGDIASNGAITLGSKVYINGDANPGADDPFSGTPPVSGSYGTLQVPLSVDPIVLPEDISSVNDNELITITTEEGTTPYTGGPDVSLASTTVLTLPGGTFYFTSITLAGQSSINVTGASTVYIDGGAVDVDITGQGIMNSGLPTNLIIYYTGTNIKLAGQASFSGAIYAPLATVTMSGQADIYGSIVCGSSIDSGQAAIHYDENLADVMPPFVVNKVTSWQEVQE